MRQKACCSCIQQVIGAHLLGTPKHVAVPCSHPQHSWIRGTGINPTLPPCFATELPVLSTDVHENAAAAAGHASTAAIAIAVAFAAGGAVLLTVAGRTLLRRRRRQRRAAERSRQQGLEQAQLLRAPEMEREQLQGGRRNAASRRARVDALLQGGGGRSIAMLRLNSLPEALQHQMVDSGSGRRGWESGRMGALPAADPQLGGIELQQLRRPLERGGGSGMPHDMLGSWVEASASSAMPTRQWRLGTNSLQLGAGELTVRGRGGRLAWR